LTSLSEGERGREGGSERHLLCWASIRDVNAKTTEKFLLEGKKPKKALREREKIKNW